MELTATHLAAEDVHAAAGNVRAFVARATVLAVQRLKVEDAVLEEVRNVLPVHAHAGHILACGLLLELEDGGVLVEPDQAKVVGARLLYLAAHYRNVRHVVAVEANDAAEVGAVHLIRGAQRRNTTSEDLKRKRAATLSPGAPPAPLCTLQSLIAAASSHPPGRSEAP
eukprot:355627-Chlamydomonas_euryale.AAC.20